MTESRSRWAETHERIAEAAHELFAAHGYDAVSVADVADAAGVAERTVFRHFPEKHRLAYPEADDHLAVLRHELAEELAPNLGGDEDTARVAAAAVVTMITDTIRRWLLDDARAPLDAVARQIADKHREAYTYLLAG